MASAGKKVSRTGRGAGADAAPQPGCDAPGEFRAPGAAARPSFDGPGDWRWLCLDHVRAFNSGYNYFDGMSPDEISDAQNPYGGWERETRAFGTAGAVAAAALGRFRRSARRDRRPLPPTAADAPRGDGRELSEGDRKHLRGARPRPRRRPAGAAHRAMPSWSAATIPTATAATAATRKHCRR